MPDLAMPDLAKPDLAMPDLTSSADMVFVNPFHARVFVATSYMAQAETVFEITSGVAKVFATVNANGWVGPLVVTATGHMFVVTNAAGGSLYDISAGGDFTKAVPSATNVFGNALGYPEGLAFDALGNAYISNSEKGMQKLAVVAPNGALTQLPTPFNNPTALRVIGRQLYISEAGAGRVVLHDLDKGTESVFATGFVTGQSHVSGSSASTERGTS